MRLLIRLQGRPGSRVRVAMGEGRCVEFEPIWFYASGARCCLLRAGFLFGNSSA